MTLSSMFSPTQHEDKKFLMELAELITLLVKLKTPQALDLAEKFGAHYLTLDEKVKTHDYTQDDESYYNLIKHIR